MPVLTKLILGLATTVGVVMPSFAEPIEVFRPAISYQTGAAQRDAEIASVIKFLGTLPLEIEVTALPVKRASFRYNQSDGSCLVYGVEALAFNEIETMKLLDVEMWLFRLVGSKSVTETIGTVLGAEHYIDFTRHPNTRWHFASNYEAMLKMLKAGRVNAITINPRNLSDPVFSDINIEKADTKPFLDLSLSIRCKRTEKTELFVRMVNQQWPKVKVAD